MQAFLEPGKEAAGKQKLYVGCISWTYPDWNGPFYPSGARSSELLSLYSKIFDLVEVDSSFYRTPSSNAVKQWKDRTPSNFKFTVKMPKRISHEAKLQKIENELEYFENTILGLGEKLACVFVQLSPSFKFDSDFAKLESFLDKTNPALRYAFEFRNNSWLVDETYNLLVKKKSCLVWGVGEHLDIFPKITTDFVYLRFMGDFNEFQKFDRIQKDKTEILRNWWKNLRASMDKLTSAFVLVSNHFAGFAPENSNQFRKYAGLTEVNWRDFFSRTRQS